jgi:hypothetical protein
LGRSPSVAVPVSIGCVIALRVAGRLVAVTIVAGRRIVRSGIAAVVVVAVVLDRGDLLSRGGSRAAMDGRCCSGAERSAGREKPEPKTRGE